jgi:hypothetical protein
MRWTPRTVLEATAKSLSSRCSPHRLQQPSGVFRDRDRVASSESPSRSRKRRRYARALRSLFMVSPCLPMPVRHNQPLIRSVVWQWSRYSLAVREQHSQAGGGGPAALRRRRPFFSSALVQVLHVACLYDPPDFFHGPILLKASGGSSAPQPLHSFSSWPPQAGGGGGGGQVPAPSEPEAPGLGGVDGDGG